MNSHIPMIFRVIVSGKKRKRTVLHIAMLFVSNPMSGKMSICDFKEHSWLKDAEVGLMPEEASSGSQQFTSNNNVGSFSETSPVRGLNKTVIRLLIGNKI